MTEKKTSAKKARVEVKIDEERLRELNKCAKCDELEKRIEALELSRKAFDAWTSAFGHYPLSIFEEQVRDAK